MLSAGKLVKDEQLYQALSKSITFDVSINGKDVRPVQPSHALSTLVKFDASSMANVVKFVKF